MTWMDDGEPDESYTYELTGDAAESGMFAVNPATGQITVTQAPTLNNGVGQPRLDFETKNSYTGQVEFTVQGQPAVMPFTIKPNRRGVRLHARCAQRKPAFRLAPLRFAGVVECALHAGRHAHHRLRFAVQEAG